MSTVDLNAENLQKLSKLNTDSGFLGQTGGRDQFASALNLTGKSKFNEMSVMKESRMEGSRSPKKSVRSSNKKQIMSNLNSAPQSNQQSDFFKMATKSQLARFVQDPVAAVSSNDQFSTEVFCMASQAML